MVTLEELSHRLLQKNEQELEPEERRALHSILNRKPISQDAAEIADARETYGERLADRVAAIGGSWGFIIGFTIVLITWMVLNSDILPQFKAAFDPYPYIFLNLMLSTIAAIQAPVIMMSQNRKDNRDRTSAGLDYEVNLRAELEIMQLHRKLDESVLARLDRIEKMLVERFQSDMDGQDAASDKTP
ncbi:DUF1003 domain-containing protein [Aurantiacibacter rhizosphaerae]|uniref:DUF1003 domain-containing protein n=1 Tax=Aurantiacibacter rhizosphaerae TaxID=2691582 RepID=A0A844XI59_9SPHN|nr:DUF1003 domain-containing protein [Aurantiacibacter rhizosphaerae]MWV29244.1 DUF1003 domain-containing protein [Aurantiacibacter rhizosphaerae]